MAQALKIPLLGTIIASSERIQSSVVRSFLEKLSKSKQQNVE